jgi:glycosyltransferase involved in cell wall biosynthesis
MPADPILIVHNYYQLPGGEDEVFHGEAALLEAHGHRVVTVTRSNHDLALLNPLQSAAASVFNPATYRAARALLREVRPTVMHVHNTLPLISPAIYYAARAEGVPVVQTLHNYRLVCPSATLFRDGHPCQDCVGRRVPWPGVVHACYRDSRAASAVVASMLTTHRAIGTWSHAVDVYIALTEAMRRILIRGGVPAERMVVKPNFVAEDPGVGARAGGYALYVGRLAEVKGIRTLLAAWPLVDPSIPLKIVGDGPLQAAVVAAAQANPHIEWLGQQPRGRVQELMRDAYALIFPSEWHEPISLVLLEALAAGLPVVASKIGSGASLIEHARTGLHFRSGEERALAEAVVAAWHQPRLMASMAEHARREYEAHYTSEINYRMLLDIYSRARARHRRP